MTKIAFHIISVINSYKYCRFEISGANNKSLSYREYKILEKVYKQNVIVTRLILHWLQLILLDTRTFFDPINEDVLGDVQWQWLKEQLQEDVALTIIGSSIQVSSNYKSYLRFIKNLPSIKSIISPCIYHAKFISANERNICTLIIFCKFVGWYTTIIILILGFIRYPIYR